MRLKRYIFRNLSKDKRRRKKYSFFIKLQLYKLQKGLEEPAHLLK